MCHIIRKCWKYWPFKRQCISSEQCFFPSCNLIHAFSQVNGKDMRNATHQEAVAALIANVSLVKLLVRHDPPPKGLQVSVTNLSCLLSYFSRVTQTCIGQKKCLFQLRIILFFVFSPKSFSCLQIIQLLCEACHTGSVIFQDDLVTLFMGKATEHICLWLQFHILPKGKTPFH